MPIRRLFLRHPTSVDETYLQHLCAASGFGVWMLLAGLACMMHALLPFLFERTASRCISQLHTRMIVKRAAKEDASASSEQGSH